MNLPPLRPVTTPPPGRPGSLLNTARAVRAVSLISALDDGEPISSSAVNRAVIGDGAAANCAKAASTKALMATPAFMSQQPGPEPRPSTTRNGRRPASPVGNTVSRWPSSNTAAFDALSATLSTCARMASPKRSLEMTENATPCSARKARNRAPTASTPALSWLPLSISTSARMRSSMASLRAASQSSTAVSVSAGNVIVRDSPDDSRTTTTRETGVKARPHSRRR